MTAAGDAVLALAYTQVGTQSGDQYWAWWGADLGSYCACFVSWCGWHANYPVCPIDGSGGFVLVSNGTWHSYSESEAKPTADLQPGDVILFSWYSWDWQDGMPVITDPEWAGWIAGDHTGLFSHWIDQGSGQFATVEGNTLGGVVAYREDRWTSQVCGWWRTPSMEGAWPPDPPKPTFNLTGLGMFLLANTVRGVWLMGPGYAKHLDPEQYGQAMGIPGIGTFDTGDNVRAWDVVYASCMEGTEASEQ
jgi:hypothetical protein